MRVEEVAVSLEKKKSIQHARDNRRHRELYKYLETDDLDSTPLDQRAQAPPAWHHASNITASLEPLAQLAALRCGAQKAMINVMDSNTMYFLAEATTAPDGDLGDHGTSLNLVEDPIFLGCSGVPLEGRICEMTIRADSPGAGRSVPVFYVPDLSLDPRFSPLSVVSGPPYYRYYAGTPIRTKDGVNIGSVAIMDLKPRENLSMDHEKCLGDLAEHVMNFLDINRQAMFGRKSLRLGQGFQAFMAGKDRINDTKLSEIPTHPEIFMKGAAAYGVPPSATEDLKTAEAADSPHTTSSDSEDAQYHHARRKHAEDDNVDIAKQIFQRASGLIQESLDIGDTGGCVFFEEVSGVTNQINHESDLAEAFQAEQDLPLGVLAVSPPHLSIFAVGKQFRGLDPAFFHELLERHPSGRSWVFDGGGSKISSDDDDAVHSAPASNTRERPRRKSSFKQRDGEELSLVFPEARSILFYPVFDVLTHRNVVAFVYDTSSTQFLGAGQLTYVNSFCNTAKAECNRVDAVRSEIQKDRFVSTISHEMRSPLHGVLASVEFLEETTLDTSQRALLDSIGACGRTLLDTIDMILSYAKIASFEKNWQSSRSAKQRQAHLSRPSMGKRMSSAAPQMLQLYAATDISILLEEVLDGVAIGHHYAKRTSHEGHDYGERETNGNITDDSVQTVNRRDRVEVIIDIQRDDFVFLTVPGSIRRIFMNLFGNSCKYTSKGSIIVQLRLVDAASSDVSETEASQVAILTITDTGKGMSPEFLSTKLFTPFCQENSISPGTGLGLSIVRSIVGLLGGTIKVSSEMGVGTSIRVQLPMTRSPDGSASSQTSVQVGSDRRSRAVSELHGHDQKHSVLLFKKSASLPKSLLHEALRKQIVDWCGFPVTADLTPGCGLVVVEEDDFDSCLNLLRRSSHMLRNIPIIVLCDPSSSRRQEFSEFPKSKHPSVSVILKPCGPHKLAAAMLATLRGVIVPNGWISQSLNDVVPTEDAPEVVNIADTLSELVLRSPGAKDVVVVQANESFAAAQGSINAQMALTTPNTIDGPQAGFDDARSFPFPDQDPSSPAGPREQPPKTRHRGLSIRKVSDSVGVLPASLPLDGVVDDIKPCPKVLLVDDNFINLRLLQTFMKKRHCRRIDSAEDGQQALEAVQNAKSEPYDVIFMDISMPIMNGFDATKAIRAFEAANSQGQVQQRALIIALTGLAGAKDQADAFVAGCDIYMTKPVKFKKVGLLLDNFDAHRRNSVEEENGLDKEGIKEGITRRDTDGVVRNGNGLIRA